MNLFKTVTLLSLLTALFVLISYLLIDGVVGAIVGLAIALIINLITWQPSLCATADCQSLFQ